ncbi:MAG: hypothetical protein WD906_00980 [Anaerolineales bacterium]
MKRRNAVAYLLAEVVALSIACSAAAFVALPSAGALGGITIGVDPRFAFGIVERSVCPDGSLEFTSIRRSYHRPGEAEMHLDCVASDGSRSNVLLQGVLLVLGVAFLAIFVPVFVIFGLPLGLIAYLVTRAIVSLSNGPIGAR